MRNPIRAKHLHPQLRFAPLYVGALALMLFDRPRVAAYEIGLAVLLVGAALRTWAVGHLVKTESLTISGPYAHLRHPLYLGTLLIGGGVAAMAGGLWTAGLLVLFLPWFFLSYLPRKERSESARLESRYGAAFREYRDAVPALIPRLRAWEPSPAARTLADPDRRWSLARYSENNELGTQLALVVTVVAFAVRAGLVLAHS